MKKNIFSIFLAIILLVGSVSNVYAGGHDYKRFKKYTYEKTSYKSIAINFYRGKKKSIVIPEKIKKIKVTCVDLFRAKGVKKIKIPRYVKDVCLSRNKSLKKVTIDKRNKYITVSNNCILNKKKTKLLSVLGGYKEIRIPETVKVIDGTPFLGSNVSKIIITKNVKKVTFGAFSKCFKVKEIVFEGDKLPPNMEGWPSRNWGSKLENSMKFYVKNETLADKLLEKIDGKSDLYAKVYVGDKLVREKQLNYNLNY